MLNKHFFWRFLYKAHHYIGLLSALVLLMLAITGIALNHTEDLKLDSQFISSPTILDWYGIESPKINVSFNSSDYYLSQFDNKLYLNQQEIFKSSAKLLGMIATEQYIAVALNDSLLLVSLEGELIEQIPFSDLKKIGVDKKQQIVIQKSESILYTDDDLLSWKPTTSENHILWSKEKTPPKEITQALENSARYSILPLERVLLDIHSGRFFGKVGIIIIDVCGILLIILTLSGCLIWSKHKLRAWKKTK